VIRVSVVNTHHRHRVAASPIVRAVRQVLRRENRGEAAIGVICINSARSRRLNRTFLGHDYVTDVLTFPLEERLNLEAEIYVNLDRVRQQAREFGVGFSNELARMVIHGVLHLVGYDDAKPRAARRMKEAEDRYLRSLRIRG
jgi:probable rRNA maturation factor